MTVIIGITKLSLTPAASEELSYKAYSAVQTWLDSFDPRKSFDHCIAADRDEGVAKLAKMLRKYLDGHWAWRSGGSPDSLQFEVSWIEARGDFFCPVTRVTSGTKYKMVDYPSAD